MDKSNVSSNRADWVIFALRWLIVISGILLFATGRSTAPQPQPLMTALVVYSLYNLLVALLLMVGMGGNFLRLFTLAVDAGAALLFFWATGMLPLVFIGASLLPVIITAVRFGTARGLAFAVTLSVLALLISVMLGRFATTGLELIPSALFLLTASGLVGSLNAEKDAPSVKPKSQSAGIPERAKAIYNMAMTLGATLDYEKVLEAALDMGVLGVKDEHIDSTQLSSMALLFENDQMRIITGRRLTRQDMTKTTPGKDGILGQALRQAEPIFGSDAHEDPELKYFAGFQDSKSLLVIPLRAGYNNYGLLVFGAPTHNAFSEEHRELLDAIGTQATVALQNAVLYQNLLEEKERIVDVEEDARKKLARDLHDGPTQGVAAIAMRVSYIKRLVETKPGEATEELTKVEDLARKTTKEIRHMLFTLRPLVLETQGLTPALQQFAEKMKDTHNLNVVVQSQAGVDESIESHAQGVLFYIVEEAVGNARKHAQAEQINVRLYKRDKNVIVEIQDNGVGFDVDSVNEGYDKRGSLGMVNMRERAALVEGTLRVESASGKGTKISVLVPIKRDLNQLNSETQPPTNGMQRPTQLSGRRA